MTLKKLLFIDDEPNVLRSYERTLRDFRSRWQMAFETCPVRAWNRITREPFDTIISDVRMPRISGLELLERIKGDQAICNVPVIIVTGEADKSLKRRALDLDATDLLNKPVDSDDLVARIQSALRVKHYADQLRQQNEELERRVRKRTAELNASRIDIIWRLAKAAEYRDEETGNHVARVANYSRIVAKTLGLSESFCETLYLAAPLHDIGKIGVPDSILRKPGSLNEDEWVAMRKHCEMGVAILTEPSRFVRSTEPKLTMIRTSQSPLRSCNAVIEMAAEIAQSHHEKWDGNGYPNGLSGDQIPLAARIVAIADVYDALRSARPYKKQFSVEDSIASIKNGSASHFEPRIVGAFLKCLDRIRRAEIDLADSGSVPPNSRDQTSLIPASMVAIQ